MLRMKFLSTSVLAAALALHAGAARADTHINYNGGPVMRNVRIWPIYYGNPWTTTAGIARKNAQGNYLSQLAAYMQGTGVPAGQSPTTRQYGVLTASAGPGPTVAATPAPLTDAQIRGIISTQQAAGKVPAYGPDVFIIVYPATGFTPNRCGQPGANDNCDQVVWRAYHASVNSTSYYSAVFEDQGSFTMDVMSSHEILEGAASPVVGAGWANGVDAEICDDGACGGVAPIFTVNGIRVFSCADNTRGGTCPATGFIDNPARPTSCGIMRAGQGLIPVPGLDRRSSCDGRTLLVMSTTGQLALYRDNFLLWQTPTVFPALSAIMQPDGNLVVSRGFGMDGREAVWAANTFGQTGAYLRVQNDANLVVYKSNGIPIWAYNTPQAPATCGRFNANQGLSQGTSWKSCNTRFNLVMQLDGNLVLYQNTGAVIWASNTGGWGNLVEAVMQPDGNFVVYNRANSPMTALWAAGSNPTGSYFRIHDDGNLAVYNSSNGVVWQSNTGGH